MSLDRVSDCCHIQSLNLGEPVLGSKNRWCVSSSPTGLLHPAALIVTGTTMNSKLKANKKLQERDYWKAPGAEPCDSGDYFTLRRGCVLSWGCLIISCLILTSWLTLLSLQLTPSSSSCATCASDPITHCLHLSSLAHVFKYCVPLVLCQSASSMARRRTTPVNAQQVGSSS